MHEKMVLQIAVRDIRQLTDFEADTGELADSPGISPGFPLVAFIMTRCGRADGRAGRDVLADVK